MKGNLVGVAVLLILAYFGQAIAQNPPAICDHNHVIKTSDFNNWITYGQIGIYRDSNIVLADRSRCVFLKIKSEDIIERQFALEILRIFNTFENRLEDCQKVLNLIVVDESSRQDLNNSVRFLLLSMYELETAIKRTILAIGGNIRRESI